MKIYLIYNNIDVSDIDEILTIDAIESYNIGIILDLDFIPRVNELVSFQYSILNKKFIEKIINKKEYISIKDKLKMYFDYLKENDLNVSFIVGEINYVSSNFNNKIKTNIVLTITLDTKSLKEFLNNS